MLVWLSDQNIYIQIFEHYIDKNKNKSFSKHQKRIPWPELCQKRSIMDVCRTNRWKDIINNYFLIPRPIFFKTEITALKLPFWKGHHT